MTPTLIDKIAQALGKDKAAAENASAKPPARQRPKKFGIGSVVDERYRLEALIGRGGMGTVYRARDLANDGEVALKVINLGEVNALSKQQFTREAEISAQLTHPHIVKVFQTGTTPGGAPYLAMELVNGRGLDDLRGLTYARIIELGLQICDALDYAHSQGFVHRDLKPANVLVEKCGFQLCARLADFGLARPRGEANLPSESNMAGSFFYLAPEVIAGQLADVSSDLYALGVMLYELVTGRVPFSDFSDEDAVFSQHLEQPAPPPSHSRADVPPALEALIMKLLEKNPAQRYASAREVREALAGIRAEQQSLAQPGNLPDEAPAGREDEAAQVCRLFERGRLVRLPGDDLALALAAGRQLRQVFPDGAWLADLSGLDDPALVLERVAEALGARQTPERALTVALVEQLREKNLLLVLRGHTRLRFACAQLAETLLRTCPEVHLLALGMETLGVAEELEFRNPDFGSRTRMEKYRIVDEE